MYGLISGLSILLFVYMPVSMPSAYCFDYCSFTTYFEMVNCDDFTFVLLAQDCFVYSGSFVVPYEFSISIKKVIGILIVLPSLCVLLLVVLPS